MGRDRCKTTQGPLPAASLNNDPMLTNGDPTLVRVGPRSAKVNSGRISWPTCETCTAGQPGGARRDLPEPVSRSGPRTGVPAESSVGGTSRPTPSRGAHISAGATPLDPRFGLRTAPGDPAVGLARHRGPEDAFVRTASPPRTGALLSALVVPLFRGVPALALRCRSFTLSSVAKQPTQGLRVPTPALEVALRGQTQHFPELGRGCAARKVGLTCPSW